MKKKRIILAAVLMAVTASSAGCGAVDENVKVDPAVSVTTTADVTTLDSEEKSEEKADEKSRETENEKNEDSETQAAELSETKKSEDAGGQEQGEKSAYAPIDAGVWVNQDSGIQYIFYEGDNSGRTYDDQTGTGSPFEYQCTSDGYIFHFGSADNNTPATAEFNTDGTITFTFNHPDGRTVTGTFTQISSDPEAQAGGMLDEGGNFLGIWGCGRASMKVTDGETGGRYVVTITWAGSAFETSVWTYKCKYSEEEGGLVSDSGELRVEVYESEGTDPEVTVTDGQEAVFTIGADGIKWDDKINNSGADMLFTR